MNINASANKAVPRRDSCAALNQKMKKKFRIVFLKMKSSRQGRPAQELQTFHSHVSFLLMKKKKIQTFFLFTSRRCSV